MDYFNSRGTNAQDQVRLFFKGYLNVFCILPSVEILRLIYSQNYV